MLMAMHSCNDKSISLTEQVANLQNENLASRNQVNALRAGAGGARVACNTMMAKRFMTL